MARVGGRVILACVIALVVDRLRLPERQHGVRPGVPRAVTSVLVGLPLATAMAVLRYRLYDLDLVVKKTAIYSIVAIALTALYLLLLGGAALAGLGPFPAAIVFVITFNPVAAPARKLADRIVYGKRATPFEVLSEFSERVGETYSIDDVLPRMTQLLAAGTGAREARTWIRHGRTLRSAAVAPACAEPTPDVELAGDELPAFGDDVHAFPVTHQGELLGAITLAMAANDPMDADEGAARTRRGVAGRTGAAQRAPRGGPAGLPAPDRGRAGRAGEGAGAQHPRRRAAAARGALGEAAAREQLAERDPPRWPRCCATCRARRPTTLEDLRDLARGIYPPLLADKGLAAALEAQARKAAVPVASRPATSAGIPGHRVDRLLLRARGAEQRREVRGGRAAVDRRWRGPTACSRSRCATTGSGSTRAPTYGTGLQGMADRLDAVGGSLRVESRPGEGTIVHGEIPVNGRRPLPRGSAGSGQRPAAIARMSSGVVPQQPPTMRAPAARHSVAAAPKSGRGPSRIQLFATASHVEPTFGYASSGVSTVTLDSSAGR